MKSPNRRQFITRSLTSAAALTALASAAQPADPDNHSFHEPGRDLPLKTDADVIVCGAGPAGVTAAITAARAGAKVRLFEAHGSLGGVWTSSLLGYLLDFDKPGFNQELVRRLREREAIHGQGMNAISYHPEEMKLLLEELCGAAGVRVQHHARVTAAHREGRRLTTIVTESKSGRQAWRAPVFIDTTGDGDLAALAGCAFEIGVDTACPCQPMSMCALLVVQDATRLAGVINATQAPAGSPPRTLKSEIERAGIESSYTSPIIFQMRDNLLLAMMNHEYGINATDAAQVTDATQRARAELHRIVRALRKLGGAWEGVQIAATPEQIGIRDGRRIRGRYVVNKEDVASGARHDDAVVRATYIVDVHALTEKIGKTTPWSTAGVKTKPYDIPLRALIARDVDGLMMAGRCISGDFIAHASYRVTGNAVAMGEAAGATATLAAQTGRAPHEVPWAEVRPLINKTREQPSTK